MFGFGAKDEKQKKRREEAKTERKEAKAAKEKAQAERIKAKNEVRSKEGGAGIKVVFFDKKSGCKPRKKSCGRGRCR